MCPNAESISIPLRRTQDFVRSVVPVLELLGYDDSVLEGLGSRFVLSVDVDGLRLHAEDSDSPVALEFPWAVIGRVRNDWVRREPVGPLDVVLALSGLGASTESEVNATVLVVPVSIDERVSEMRLTLSGLDGIARTLERLRPKP